MPVDDERIRCAWAATPLSIAYHDREWGTPVRDDRTFFEFLVLEGAQAGLSWETILRKREGYRRAFAGFEIERVANFGDREYERLLADAGIVRNRGKIRSAIENARAVVRLREETGDTFAAYLWSAVGGAPIVNRPATHAGVPARTDRSTALSRDLTRRGFRFVGPTIVYSLMQATGLVDDHVADCFRVSAPDGAPSRARDRRSRP